MSIQEPIVRMALTTAIMCLGYGIPCEAQAPCIQDPIVVNPGFEMYAIQSSNWDVPNVVDLNVQPGSADVSGWKVIHGPIDYVGIGGWQASEGQRSLDLSGDPGNGGVEQEIKTIAGVAYRLTFEYSGNPDPNTLFPNDDTAKKLRASVADMAVDFVYDTAIEGNLPSNMKWKSGSVDFVATGSLTTLRFVNIMPATSYTGPTLDDVKVVRMSWDYGCAPDLLGPIQLLGPSGIPEGSLALHAYESDASASVIPESCDTILSGSVGVNATGSGKYTEFGNLVTATIAAGTKVNSYLVHYDPASAQQNISGIEVIFQAEILGVIVLDADLNASDALVGADSLAYPTGQSKRGLEMSAQQDRFEISQDKRKLMLELEVWELLDQIRVITAACVCQEEFGSEGPGVSKLCICGVGLGFGESSALLLIGAPAGSPVYLLASLTGFPNVQFAGGTLLSVGGLIAGAPFAFTAGQQGGVALAVPGSPVLLDIVIQGVSVDGSATQGYSISNAVLARFGQ